MNLADLDIIVLGGGIGGLTASLCLARSGAQVLLVEQAPALREVGAGIQISPNGFHVLQALGLGDKLRAVSGRGEAVCLVDYSGKPVVRLPLSTSEGGTYHLVHRADLQEVLIKSCRAAGIEMRLGCEAADIVPDHPATLTTTAEETFHADLIVAADGLHSVARARLNPESEGFFTGQVAWRALVPEIQPETQADPEIRVFMGPRRHLVTYPLR
ncbi:MAG: FAD-dependent monooxygenase, partial [Pseudomonadota bacterium]